MCSTISWCINKSEYSTRFGQLVSMEDNKLNPMSKQILRNRYINLVNSLEVKPKRSGFWYSTLNTFTRVVESFTIEKDVKLDFLSPVEWKKVKIDEEFEDRR